MSRKNRKRQAPPKKALADIDPVLGDGPVEYPDAHLRGHDMPPDDHRHWADEEGVETKREWVPTTRRSRRYASLDAKLRSDTPGSAWLFPIVLVTVVGFTALVIQRTVEVPPDASPHTIAAASSWMMMTMLFSVMFAFTIIVSNVLVFRAGPPRPALAISIGTTIAGILAVAIAWSLRDKMLVPADLESAITATAFKVGGVRNITSILNGCAAWATIVVIAGSCALIAHEVETPRELSRQLRASKILIYVASALLITGVFAVSALYNWPAHAQAPANAAAKASEDPAVRKVAELGRSATTLVGVTFTLVLASTYLPLVFLQRQRAYRIIHPWDRTEAWLSIHGFSLQPSQQLGRLMVILGPLIAGGPLTHLISLIPD